MKGIKWFKFYSVVLALIIGVLSMSAQTSGDKLYNDGISLQKKMTVADQKNAISKFTSAKKLYDSQAKKKQCDDAIQVSRNIISKLSSSSQKPSSKKQQEAAPEKEKEVYLELSNRSFETSCEPSSFTVTVNTDAEKWSVDALTNSDGTSFLTVRKGNDNKITIYCNANELTRPRVQNIIVTADKIKKEITVTQLGKEIYFDIDNKLLEFKKKGGKKEIKILSNSDETYPENNNQNWYVISKPKWIEVIIDSKKDSGFLSKGVGAVGGLLVGKKKVEVTDAVVTPVIIYATEFSPSVKTQTSQSGEVVFGSGYKRITVKVYQK